MKSTLQYMRVFSCVYEWFYMCVPGLKFIYQHIHLLSSFMRNRTGCTIYFCKIYQREGKAQREVRMVALVAWELTSSSTDHTSGTERLCLVRSTLIKKKIEFSSYIHYKEIQNGAVAKSYIDLTASPYMVKYLRISIYILGSPSSYMT